MEDGRLREGTTGIRKQGHVLYYFCSVIMYPMEVLLAASPRDSKIAPKIQLLGLGKRFGQHCF